MSLRSAALRHFLSIRVIERNSTNALFRGFAKDTAPRDKTSPLNAWMRSKELERHCDTDRRLLHHTFGRVVAAICRLIPFNILVGDVVFTRSVGRETQ
jgi:hypothetical protein